MDNIELLKTLQEIHRKYFGDCSKCPLSRNNTKSKKSGCNNFNIGDNAEEIIEICEQWRKEHPVKTYADVFFEQFPNADYTNYNSTKIPNIAFKHLYGGNYIDMETDVKLWFQPYPEDKK